MAKKNKVKEFLKSPIALAIAYIVIGILLCVKQSAVIEWIMIIAGAFFIVQGAIDWFVEKDIRQGVIEIVAGVVIIVLRFVIPQVVMVALGAILIFKSVVAILTLPKSIANTVYNIVALIIGILLIVGNWIVADWFFIIIGVAFIINGALTLFGKNK